MVKKVLVFTLLLIIILFSQVPVGYANDPDEHGGTSVKLDNPLGSSDTSVPVIIGRIINAVLGLVGSLALIMFIYGGLTWMTAAGASEKIQKGKDIIVWAAIGMIVIFSSYAITKFVLDAINKGG